MIDRSLFDNDPHLDRSEAIPNRLASEPPFETWSADRAKELAVKNIETSVAPLVTKLVGLRLSKSAPTERLRAARSFASAHSSYRRKM
jgi:hypothetical protein